MPVPRLLVLTVWLAVCQLGAPPARALDFDLDGRLELEVDARPNFERTELDEEAQLDIETEREGGWRGEVDLKAEVETAGVSLRELFLEHRSENGNRFLVGQSKKRFGLEEDLGMDERLTLSHGALYRKLALFGYIGRDAMIGYRAGDPDERVVSHDLSFHSSNGLNAAALYQLKFRESPDGTIHAYLLLHSNLRNHDWMMAGAGALGWLRTIGSVRIEAEIMGGKDPLNSRFFRMQGDTDRNVLFAAGRAGTSVRFGDIAPFAQLTYVMHDERDPGDRTVEAILGSRVHAGDDLIFGGEIRLDETRYPAAGVTPPGLSTATGIFLSARYYF